MTTKHVSDKQNSVTFLQICFANRAINGGQLELLQCTNIETCTSQKRCVFLNTLTFGLTF